MTLKLENLEDEDALMHTEQSISTPSKLSRKAALAKELREKHKPEMDFVPEEKKEDAKVFEEDEDVKDSKTDYPHNKTNTTDKIPDSADNKLKKEKVENTDRQSSKDLEEASNIIKYKFVNPTKITSGVILEVKKQPKLVNRPMKEKSSLQVSKETQKELKKLVAMLDNVKLIEYTEAALEHYKNYIFDIK